MTPSTSAPPRPLWQIAADIRKHWDYVWFGALPYLQALDTLDYMSDYYGCDSADMIVRYFLASAAYWRGPDARRCKSELKSMLAAAR